VKSLMRRGLLRVRELMNIKIEGAAGRADG
jgi:hypothetical protein